MIASNEFDLISIVIGTALVILIILRWSWGSLEEEGQSDADRRKSKRRKSEFYPVPMRGDDA
jgi:hypothetical protein